jgi:hypothetical protein
MGYNKLNVLRVAIILCLVTTTAGIAQELNFNVMVNDEMAQTSERQVFRDMEQAFARFLNERRWTSDVFLPEEKINGNLMITIESMPTVGQYTATVQVQSSRPVYNTNYESLVLNFADRDWQFEYVESTPLEFNDNLFTTNLTAMLAFYAYIVIGLDYDTYAPMGGDQYIQKALNVVNLAQNSSAAGWQAFQSNRNRYWLVENLLNQQLLSIREGLYTYHRQSLDVFIEKPEEARKNILEIIKSIQTVNRVLPNSILKIAFFDAKADEIASIYKEGNIALRREAYNLLAEIDPSKTEKYRGIIEN